MENHIKTEFINAFKGKAIVDTEYGRMIHPDYNQYVAVIGMVGALFCCLFLQVYVSRDKTFSCRAIHQSRLSVNERIKIF